MCILRSGEGKGTCEPMTRGGLWALAAALVLGPLGCGADPLNHWTRRTSGIGTETAAVLYAGNQFLAVGAQGATLNSTDGVSWLSHYGAGNSTFLYGIAYGQNLFVAVGDSGALQTSKNGTNW